MHPSGVVVLPALVLLALPLSFPRPVSNDLAVAPVCNAAMSLRLRGGGVDEDVEAGEYGCVLLYFMRHSWLWLNESGPQEELPKL